MFQLSSFRLRFSLLLLLSGLFPMLTKAQLTAYFNYAAFQSPKSGAYIETYLTIAGRSVKSMPTKNHFRQAGVGIEIMFTQNNAIVKANRYHLFSPETLDSLRIPNFIDVQRYSLPYGAYDVQISLTDLNDSAATRYDWTEKITIVDPSGKIHVSDIELLDTYTKSTSSSVLSKSGYDMIPYCTNYYPNHVNTLQFYCETYGTSPLLGNESRNFAFVYFIESAENLLKIGNFQSFQRQKCQAVNALLGKFDISSLYNGNYNLVVQIVDKENKIYAEKKIPFTRLNPKIQIKQENITQVVVENTFASAYTDKDQLIDHIQSLWPISSFTERQWQFNQIQNADVSIMQKYLYAFWKNRDDKNPEAAWKKYQADVIKADQLFRAGKVPGYRTDRGRVFLQYGMPDSRQEITTEPDSYPYEIWHYHRLNDPVMNQMQTNRKFVFYNREMAGNNYELLHSDARGEVKEARWQMRLKQRTQTSKNFDVEKAYQQYGNQAEDLFNNPR